MGLSDSRFDWEPSLTDNTSKISPSLDGLIHVCHDPILDYVVLSKSIQGVMPRAIGYLTRPGVKYHLYACLPLRTLPDPFPPSP
jgi:hypothetical protein